LVITSGLGPLNPDSNSGSPICRSQKLLKYKWRRKNMTIEYSDFEKVEIRVGKIIEVEDFKEARNPSYKLKIDFGEFGIKKSAAQITENYTKEQLRGMFVISTINFKPKQIANIMSEALIMGVNDKKGNVTLLQPDSKNIALGSRIY
jgi:tRNA-binding protein